MNSELLSHLTVEERSWLGEAREEISMAAVGLCHDVPTMLCRLAESRVWIKRLVGQSEGMPEETAAELFKAQTKLEAVQEEAELYAGMPSTGECCGSGQAVARDILAILKEPDVVEQ